MNKNQLTEYVIIPALKEIPKGYSLESVMAAQMVIGHESVGARYLVQNGGGPALGVIQMEPDTHKDTWKHGDSIWDNALRLNIINDDQYKLKMHPAAERLIYDLRYNVFMLRQKLFMAPGALPSDPMEMAKYLKLNWNGGGKATDFKYYDDFMRWT